MKFPDMDQKSFLASPASGYESGGSGGGDPSDSPGKSLLSSPPIGWCLYQGGCSQFLISSKGFDSSICGWRSEFSIFFGKYYFLCIESFLSRFPMRPSFPTPQCLQPLCYPSKFSPRTERIQGTIQEILSFQIDGFLTGLSQK